MKFKKWLALLLALVLLLCATACDSTSNNRDRDNDNDDNVIADTIPSDNEQPDLSVPSIFEQNGNGPLLYRVIDDDGDIVWLFGSIHVGYEDFYPLPDYVTDALKGSDGLAVEFDIVNFESDYLAQTNALTKLVYLDGTTIRDHLSEEVYEQAVDAMEDLGIYMSVYDMYMPVLWSSLIDSSLIDEKATALGVDRHLIEAAYDLDLPVIDVESADLQYGMMASYSDDLQELLLKSSLDGCADADAYNQEVKDLMDMWAEGDAAALRKYLSSEGEDLSSEEQPLYEEYNTKMRTERDDNMTDFVLDALDDGEELFVCVGAAHVIGVNGIVDQLQAQGYTVEVVK